MDGLIQAAWEIVAFIVMGGFVAGMIATIVAALIGRYLGRRE